MQTIDDETIGKVKEFYFDDRQWTVRNLVAETGNWLTGRQVLISPYALVAVNNDHQNLVVNLTKKHIEDSPPLDSDKPVSRQFERAYYGYYGWPMYRRGPCAWGPSPCLVRDPEQWKTSAQLEKPWDPHLRTTYSVSGYHIQALDGEIGHVADFIIDDQTWWPGKKVLVSPQWLEQVSWAERKVFVNFSRETLKQSPGFRSELLPTRDYEVGLHGHYNRKGYWVDEPAARESIPTPENSRIET